MDCPAVSGAIAAIMALIALAKLLESLASSGEHTIRSPWLIFDQTLP
jgi:hypothetical protein